MVRRELELDDETDRLLSELAEAYQGDVSPALRELLQAHEKLETLVEECEKTHDDALRAQLERAERGFREGHFTTWEEVKRRNRL